jgi:hypothetical protein
VSLVRRPLQSVVEGAPPVIQIVDRALEEFLRARVPLSAHAVDVSFQTPDRTWGAALTRPTVNVFLWEVQSHTGYLATGLQQRVNRTGDIERRPTNPVVDLSYLVTAWATERRDEHELLGSVLACVLAHRAIPSEFLPDRLEGARCGLSLAATDRRIPGDFWSALDGRLKPGLQLQVALPVEVFSWQPTAAPAEQVELSVDPRAMAAKTARRRSRAGARPGAAPAAEPAPTGGGSEEKAGATELTRRRRNGAMVMEARSPRSRPAPQPES